jgi:hypothetical protein
MMMTGTWTFFFPVTLIPKILISFNLICANTDIYLLNEPPAAPCGLIVVVNGNRVPGDIQVVAHASIHASLS